MSKIEIIFVYFVLHFALLLFTNIISTFSVLRFNFLLACFFLCVTRVVLCVSQLLLESQYGQNAHFIRIVSAIRTMEGSGVNMLR